MATIQTAPTESPSLSPLMAAYLDGDARAFADLVGLLRPVLRARALRLVRNPDDADDVLQAALVKAHQARHRFVFPETHEDGSIAAWFLMIVRNAALDHLRAYGRHRDAKARFANDVGSWVQQGHACFEDDVIEGERSARRARGLRAAVRALPAPSRIVLEARLRGESMAEIAAANGLQTGAVRVRAHRGYKALRGSALALAS